MSGHNLTKLLIGGGVGLVIVVAFAVWSWKSDSPNQDVSQGGNQNASGEQPAPSVTRGPIPYDVAVPGEGAAKVAADTAVPATVSPAGPTTSALLRSFDISAVNDAFTPSNIVVYRNDTISINLTAEDHDYNFVQPDYGFNIVVKQGETKKIEFGATAAGTFTYYCSMCENKKVEGKILITEHE